MEYLLVPYARALYNVADAANKTESWLKILQELSQELSSGSAREFLENPAVTMQKKSKLLCAWLEQTAYPKELAKFIELLVLNGKINQLSAVCRLVQEFDDKARNVFRVEVLQAMELSQSYQQKIANWLEQKLSGTVLINWRVDSDLIGGFLVNVGDNVYDYSLRVRLAQLKKNILGK